MAMFILQVLSISELNTYNKFSKYFLHAGRHSLIMTPQNLSILVDYHSQVLWNAAIIKRTTIHPLLAK